MVNSKQLLTALQKRVTILEDDLRARQEKERKRDRASGTRFSYYLEDAATEHAGEWSPGVVEGWKEGWMEAERQAAPQSIGAVTW